MGRQARRLPISRPTRRAPWPWTRLAWPHTRRPRCSSAWTPAARAWRRATWLLVRWRKTRDSTRDVSSMRLMALAGSRGGLVWIGCATGCSNGSGTPRLQVQGMKAAMRALCPTSYSRESSEDLLLFTFADVEGFLTLERGYKGASDAQHVAHKAVFDATAEALRAELAPVRASCSETLVAVRCPGQPHEQQVTGPTRRSICASAVFSLREAWQLDVCASWLVKHVRQDGVPSQLCGRQHVTPRLSPPSGP